MNREILFRGKRVDNGEWIEGFYGVFSFGSFPCKPGIIIAEDAANGHWHYEKVDPSTVCQYTGLTDKNGKKIFEGDVVERKGVGVWEDYVNEKGEKWSRSTNRKKDERGIIRYDEDVTQFTSDNPCIWLGYYDDIEVIGNTYQNPELLK